MPLVTTTRDAQLTQVLSNSFGFGGTNASGLKSGAAPLDRGLNTPSQPQAFWPIPLCARWGNGSFHTIAMHSRTFSMASLEQLKTLHPHSACARSTAAACRRLSVEMFDRPARRVCSSIHVRPVSSAAGRWPNNASAVPGSSAPRGAIAGAQPPIAQCARACSRLNTLSRAACSLRPGNCQFSATTLPGR